jgi:hypothetical protein
LRKELDNSYPIYDYTAVAICLGKERGGVV